MLGNKGTLCLCCEWGNFHGKEIIQLSWYFGNRLRECWQPSKLHHVYQKCGRMIPHWWNGYQWPWWREVKFYLETGTFKPMHISLGLSHDCPFFPVALKIYTAILAKIQSMGPDRVIISTRTEVALFRPCQCMWKWNRLASRTLPGETRREMQNYINDHLFHVETNKWLHD